MTGQGKGLVGRLTKLFNSRSKQQSSSYQAEKPDRNATSYFGNVLDDNGTVICEAGPMPLDQKMSKLVEKYRSEARAAAQAPDAGGEPFSLQHERKELGAEQHGGITSSGQPHFPGSVSEIQPEASGVVFSQEQGIAEVMDGQGQHRRGFSPLSTISSLGMAYGAAAQEPGDESIQMQQYHNFLFLDSLASDTMVQSAQPKPVRSQPATPTKALLDSADGAASGPLADSWEEAMFGPAQGHAADGQVTISISPGPETQQSAGVKPARELRTSPPSKKRPSSLLGTGSSSRLSSQESMHSQKTAIRSPAKQQRRADWSSGKRLHIPEKPHSSSAVPKSGSKSQKSAAPALKKQNERTRSSQNDSLANTKAARKQRSQPMTKEGTAGTVKLGPHRWPGQRQEEAALKAPQTAKEHWLERDCLAQSLQRGSNDTQQEDGSSEEIQPRQQRREARQREKVKALLLAQEQDLNKKRQQPARGWPPNSLIINNPVKRPEPLEDVTSKQTRLGRFAENSPGSRPTQSRPASGPQKTPKSLLGSKYSDLESQLAAYEGIPNLASDSDASPDRLHSKQQCRPLEEPHAKPKGHRRVHFTDEPAHKVNSIPPRQPTLSVKHSSEVQQTKGVQHLHLEPAFRQEEPVESVPELNNAHRDKLSASQDASRPVNFWTEDDEEDVLAEALAVSASLIPTEDTKNGGPGAPLLSPSRFLQLASLPSEEAGMQGPSFSQAWDARVNMQMEFAKKLSEQHPARKGAADRKLQCVSTGMHAASRPAKLVLPGKQADAGQKGKRPAFALTIVHDSAKEDRSEPVAKSSPPRAPTLQPAQLGKLLGHLASHSSTTMLIKEATGKLDHMPQSHPAPTADQLQHSFAHARRAILQADARRMPVLTSSKTGPLWTAASGRDWDQSTITSYMPDGSHDQDLDCHPLSAPPSPSSIAASIHGHALSHVTYSPSRYTGSFRGSGSVAEEPWAPEMQAVAEGGEDTPLTTKTLAEMSALSFRPGLATEPSTRLTQATLESRAVLDTVACDVDLALLRSIWPAGHTPSTNRNFALDSGRISAPRYHPDAESVLTPGNRPLSEVQKSNMLHSTPSDYIHARHGSKRPLQWGH